MSLSNSSPKILPLSANNKLFLNKEPSNIKTNFLLIDNPYFFLSIGGILIAFSLQGLPVNIAFPLGKHPIVDSKETPTLSTILAKYLFDKPTTEFCS